MLGHRVSANEQTCADYLTFVESEPESELAALTLELTVGETYFLRYPEQFEALTTTVVPDLLRSPARGGRLRLLSAGCSTGEEAYSLAIALRENSAIAQPAILGVDLNPVSLDRARRALYTSWSLRAVPPLIHRRWFRQQGEDFELLEEIRSGVRFEQRNFSNDDPDLWCAGQYDVVFCRNVMMYFTPDLMAEVVARIAHSLSPGGYLFLGSAETLRGTRNDFELCESDGAFYYRRIDPHGREPAGRAITLEPARCGPAATRPARPLSQPQGGRESGPPPSRQPEGLLRAMELLGQDRFAEALAMVELLAASAPDSRSDAQFMLLRAALLTHSGDLVSARQACGQLIELATQARPTIEPNADSPGSAQLSGDQLRAEAQILLAMCCEGAGDLPAAVTHCSAAILADPRFAMPHVHLGRLARRTGDLATSHREYSLSAQLLPAETDRRILLFGGGFDRQGLISLCRSQSAPTGGRP